MNQRSLIIDLDGPILDGRLRHYECYSSILRKCGYSALAVEVYWKLKRRGASIAAQLELSNAESLLNYFIAEWRDQVESEEFLELDRLQPGVENVLSIWRSQGFQLVLVTMRQSQTNTLRQLSKLDIIGYFDEVSIVKGLGAQAKANAVKEINKTLCQSVLGWIGDTEADIHAARQLDLDIFVVSNGLRDEEFLRSFSPTALVENLADVNSLLKNKGVVQ